MLPSILIVDDESEIVNALKRTLQGKFEVHGFIDPKAALAFFSEYPTHIVICDMRMPDMNGAELLIKIAALNESTKRVVLTGHADLSLAEEAINKGKVSCYIAKPWDNKNLIAQLYLLVEEFKEDTKKRNAIKRLTSAHKKFTAHQETFLLKSEKAEQQVLELKEMNVELIQLGANLVSFFSQESDNQSTRIAQQAKLVAQRLTLSPAQCQHVYLAALYHKIGLPLLSPNTFKQAWQQFTEQQRSQCSDFALTSAQILANSRLLSPSGKLLTHLFERVDGQGMPNGLSGNDIPLGSKILSAVIYYDLVVRGDIIDEPISHNEAEIIIDKMIGKAFDREVVKTLFQLLTSPCDEEIFERIFTPNELTAGMQLTQDVLDSNHRKLLSADTKISLKHIEQLKEFQSTSGQHLVVYVSWPLSSEDEKQSYE